MFFFLQVSDFDYNFLGIRICSGSTNDQFMWLYSDFRHRMYQLQEDQQILQQEGRYYVVGEIFRFVLVIITIFSELLAKIGQ